MEDQKMETENKNKGSNNYRTLLQTGFLLIAKYGNL